jgi:hypothetical protein
VYARHSRMSEIDYSIEPEVECPDNDPNDAAFFGATATIDGRDAIKEYVLTLIKHRFHAPIC